MARLEACVVVGVLLLVAGCRGMQSIADVVRDANQTQFATVLEKAIDQGLLDLTTGGPYTIFVPTDDAFAKLTTEELNNVINDAAALKNVLQYHVIQGELFSWDLYSGRILNTANGHSLRLYQSGTNMYINNGQILTTDLEASNAVIHLISEVLDVPEGTIYAVARNPEYPLSTFADYLDKVHLNRTMDAATGNRYTVFMPSNEAFSNLNPVIVQHITSSSRYLRELVNYHIHAGTLHLKSLDRNGTISTMDSYHTITVTVDTDLHLNKVATLEQADIDCDNGVVHIIDHVLIPSSIASIIG